MLYWLACRVFSWLRASLLDARALLAVERRALRLLTSAATWAAADWEVPQEDIFDGGLE